MRHSLARHPPRVPVSATTSATEQLRSPAIARNISQVSPVGAAQRCPQDQDMAQLSTCGIEQPECTAISLQPDLLQRGIAAGVASAFSSMVMNPLDIVKVRRAPLGRHHHFATNAPPAACVTNTRPVWDQVI